MCMHMYAHSICARICAEYVCTYDYLDVHMNLYRAFAPQTLYVNMEISNILPRILYVNTSIFTNKYIYIHMYICIYMYIYKYIYMNMYINILYIYIHVYKYMYIYIYRCIYIYMYACVRVPRECRMHPAF